MKMTRVSRILLTMAALAMPLIPTASQAQDGNITFGSASAIPQLSGPMLLVLAALMAVLAWQLSRKVDRQRFHPLAMGAIGLASVSAAGGVGVISGAKALAPGLTITDSLLSDEGGRVTADLFCDSLPLPNEFTNDTRKSLTILSIQLNDPRYGTFGGPPDGPDECIQGDSLSPSNSCVVYCGDGEFVIPEGQADIAG